MRWADAMVGPSAAYGILSDAFRGRRRKACEAFGQSYRILSQQLKLPSLEFRDANPPDLPEGAKKSPLTNLSSKRLLFNNNNCAGSGTLAHLIREVKIYFSFIDKLTFIVFC
jgi:hypothetical protein